MGKQSKSKGTEDNLTMETLEELKELILKLNGKVTFMEQSITKINENIDTMKRNQSIMNAHRSGM